MQKKWAFVSDVARFFILFNYGGIYLDTDVEIIKDLFSILDCNAFMAIERPDGKDIHIATGLATGFISKHTLLKDILEHYEKEHFINSDGSYNQKTVCKHVTEVMEKKGFVRKDQLQVIGDCIIYPSEYFCPQDYISDKIYITSNIYSIHPYDGSWYSPEERAAMKTKKKLARFLPRQIAGHLAITIATLKTKGIKYTIKKIESKFKQK